MLITNLTILTFGSIGINNLRLQSEEFLGFQGLHKLRRYFNSVKVIFKKKMSLPIFSSDSDDSDLEALAQLSDWDTDSDAEDRHRAATRRIRRVNYMQSLEDAEFTFRFRLSKPAFQSLLDKLMPFVRVTSTR